MEKHELFNWLAFAFSAATYALYIIPILRKTETTTLSTWMSWFLMDCAVLVAMIDEHKVSYQLVAYASGCAAVLIAGWWVNASSRWTRVDAACTVLVMVAAVMWGITGNPALAVCIELLAMCIGSIPLFLQVWRSTSPLSPWPWVCNLVGAVFAVLAIVQWDIVGAAAPLTFLVLSIMFNISVIGTQRQPGANIPLRKLIDQMRD